MDLFLDVGEGFLSEMIEKEDLKCSFDLGLGGNSGRSSPLVLSSDLWGVLDSSCCSLDPLDPGMMVDPAAVVPRRLTENRVVARLISRRRNSKMRDEYILPELAPPIDSDKEEEEDDASHLIKEEEFDEDIEEETVIEEELIMEKVEDLKEEEEERPAPIQAFVPAQHWTSVVRSGGPRGSRTAKTDRRVDKKKQQLSHQLSQSPTEEYPKPAYSFSCLIAMALKNSPSGSLPVSEIYNFMCEHFPYFRTAHPGWKNSVRHNLSLGKCFQKIEKSTHGGSRKGCLWALVPSKIVKMDEEVAKWSKKDPVANRRAMKRPETLDRLERGDMKIQLRVEPEEEEPVSKGDEEEPPPMHSSSSDDSSDQSEDEGEIPPSLRPFDRQLSRSRSTATDIGVEFTEEVYDELDLLEEVLEEESIYVPVKRSRLDPAYRHAIASHP